MAFYISGPKLLFETTEISTHPNSTQQESNYIYLYTTKFGTSIKIRLNRKFESTEFETMRVNCISSILLRNHLTQCWEYYYQLSALKKKSKLSTIDHLNKMSLKRPKEQSGLKKDKQHNGQNKKEKMTNNNLQNIHIQLKIE